MASQESKQLMDRTTVLRCSKGGRVNVRADPVTDLLTVLGD